MSGGRATVGLQRGEKLTRQAGDISAISPEGHRLTDHFFLELKHYKALGYRAFFLQGNGPLAAQYEQACMQAAAYDKIPLMIAKQNNTPTTVIAPRGMCNQLIGKVPHAEVIRVTFARIGNRWCEVCLLDDLLEHKFSFREAAPARNKT